MRHYAPLWRVAERRLPVRPDPSPGRAHLAARRACKRRRDSSPGPVALVHQATQPRAGAGTLLSRFGLQPDLAWPGLVAGGLGSCGSERVLAFGASLREPELGRPEPALPGAGEGLRAFLALAEVLRPGGTAPLE